MQARTRLVISALDKSLQNEEPKNQRLSIQLSLDGFSFCIYNKQRNKLTGLQAIAFENVANDRALNLLLAELLPTIAHLQTDYDKTRIVVENPKSTLLPSALFDVRFLQKYLEFNHQINATELVLYDRMPMLDAVNVWAFSETIYHSLLQAFPAATIQHHATTLIESLLLQYKNRIAEPLVVINIRNRYFDIVVLNHNRLQLYNAFRFVTHEDLVYHCLFVFEQLGINPEMAHVVLYGDIKPGSPLYVYLSRYIRHLQFGQRNGTLQFSYVFDQIADHHFYNLIHLQQCEL
jgi:hypothetical protein